MQRSRSLLVTLTALHRPRISSADSAFLDNPYTFFKSPQLGRYNVLTQTDSEGDAPVNCGIIYIQVSEGPRPFLPPCCVL